MRTTATLVIVALAIVGIATTGHAIPPMINYQGVLLDAGSNPVTTTTSIVFAIWDQSVAGDSLWSVTRSVTPDANGGFSVLLGEVNAIPDSVFALDNVFLSLKVDTDPEMSPRQQIVSSGYAYRVGTIDGAAGGTISGDLSITGKATLGGSNTNTGGESFVAGASNTVTDLGSTVGGGISNVSSGPQSTVSGGYNNTASTFRATVGGGSYNRARGEYSTVAGGGGAADADSNSANSDYATVGGGRSNSAGGTYGTIAGGVGNTVSGDRNTIGGGSGNEASGTFATVGGGVFNISSGVASFVGGGHSNTADGDSATVNGGGFNTASGPGATIGGGASNTASHLYTTVAGGQLGDATGINAVVGGGFNNKSTSTFTTVSGGGDNIASVDRATIGGGSDNVASANRATIAGGSRNTASGGAATISGGNDNIASGALSAVPGGRYNRAAGANAVAAGFGAKAQHDGAVVIAANSESTSIVDSVYSTADEQMVLRADGHFYLSADSGGADIPAGRFLNTSTGAYLTTGGTWTNTSDANVKENFTATDPSAILAKVAALDITEWNYVNEDDAARHIGPTAQDFYALFKLGNSDKTISTIDPAGIALVAIQELDKRTQRIADLESEIRELRRLVEQMAREK